MASSEEELESTRPEFTDLSQCDSEGMFSFRRKFGCSYLPVSDFSNELQSPNDCARAEKNNRLVLSFKADIRFR